MRTRRPSPLCSLAIGATVLLASPAWAALSLEPADFPKFFDKALSQTVTLSVPKAKAGESLGSGVVYDKAGYILTCAHVVKGEKEVLVTFQGGDTTMSTAILTDTATDLALVRVEAKATEKIDAAEFGDADAMRVGATVYVVGSPFGLEDTVTKGILSAKRRRLDINVYENFLQTDAAVNPGNSGGPLYDDGGRVIAIVAAIKSKSGANAGVGFAISSRLVRPVAEGLRKDGRVKRAYLGLRAEPLSATEKRDAGIKAGAKIAAIPQNDSPAAKAGLRVGDIAVTLNGVAVIDPADFVASIAHAKPGVVMKIEVQREGKLVAIEATPIEKTDAVAPAKDRVPSLGVRVAPITPAAALLAGFAKNEIPASGVIVVEVDPGSAAAASGLTVGMVVLKVEQVAIKSVADLEQNTPTAKLQGGVLVQTIEPGASASFRLVRTP